MMMDSWVQESRTVLQIDPSMALAREMNRVLPLGACI
jgi:hypothetical protein